ncbi:uncharacterized protein LOC117329672 [Pecten maximus]|uniref:uncharacterized protein LOC117329672 n=1 Tax=Pecten maximus TaxID=6579 RepID=UPI001458E7AF|nr:uncharacterized protein LOC117329672 [Pecten maximus]
MEADDENVDTKLAPCSESSLEDPYKAHIIYSQEDVAFSNESDLDCSEQSTDDYLEVMEAVRLPVLSVSQRFGHLITGQLSKLKQVEEFSFPAHKVLKDDETQTESVTQTTASTNSENCVVDLANFLQMQSTIRTFAEILITVVRLSKIVSPGSDNTGETERNMVLLKGVRAKFSLLEKEISENFRCDVNNTTKWREFNSTDDLPSKDQKAQLDSVEGDASSTPTAAQLRQKPSPVASLCRLSELFQQARGSEGLSGETELRERQEILASDMMNILSIVREMIDDITRQINSTTESERKTKDIGLNTETDQSSVSDVITDDANDAETDGSCSENDVDSRHADTPLSILSSNEDSKISMDDLALFFLGPFSFCE